MIYLDAQNKNSLSVPKNTTERLTDPSLKREKGNVFILAGKMASALFERSCGKKAKTCNNKKRNTDNFLTLPVLIPSNSFCYMR